MSVKSILLFLVVFLSTSLVAKDLYWIGQSGDWNNPKNWSLQSGGSPANIIPGEQDNVYFDSKSFDNKFSAVNFGEVSVRSLHIDSDKIPTLLGTRIILSSKIEIKQNVALNSNIEFKSEDNNTGIINTGGFQINASVFIVKGEWELHNHLILSDKNKLVIENSTLLTKENSIQCGDFIASKGAELNLEASTIYPMFKLDLANAKKKGGSFILIDNGFERRDLGRYTGSVVTKGASTCGSLNLTTVISSNYNGQSISCAGACDGELTVTASGTPGPYSYQLLYFGFVGAITSATVYPNLCPATYTIKVVDSSNVIGPGIYASCTVDEPINEPSVLTMGIDGFINPSCHNLCDGQGFVSISGGTGAKVLNWDNGETGTTPSQLCVGNNIATITDANGCVAVDTLVINSPDMIAFDVTIDLPSCSGDSDGALLINNESGGNGGPYSYFYNPAPTSGQNTNNGIGFSSGPVTITVTDMDGCDQDSTVTITDPPVFTAGTADVTDLTCFGICNGSISALPNGGVPGYTFEWFNNASGLSTGITDSVATGLCAGDYYVVITDANGCVKTSSVVTVNEPADFNYNVVKSDVICVDSCTGSIIANPTGGTPGYTFTWIDLSDNSSAGSGSSVSDLCPGAYELTITDASGCVSTPDTIDILPGIPLDIVFTSVTPTCYDICDGELTATPTNQTGFLYSWSNGGSNQTLTGLCAQNQYIVTVTSDSGCVEIDTFNFSAPVLFDIASNQTDLQCFGDSDGSISVNVLAGGNGPVYTFDWTNVASPGSPITGDFTNTVTNLSGQAYEVTITDGAGGCDTTLTFTINSPPELTVTAVNPVDILCANTCTGEASALPVGGVLPYSFEWFDNATGLTTGITDSIATGLCEGDYYVVVTDGNNCSAISTVISITSPLPLSLTLNKIDLVCVDICNGEASSTVAGGTGPYTYSWMNLSTATNAGSNPNLTGLCPGDYELTVTDANNCPSVIDTVTVLNALPIGVSLTGIDPSCYDLCDGEITVFTTNSSGFSYVWTPGVINGQGTANVIDLCANINYVVEVTDVNGCIEKDSLTLNSIPQYDIVSTITDVTCFGDVNGSISVVVNAGGSGTPYTYNWISIDGHSFSGQGTTAITSLDAGDYTVTISDGLSCDTTLSYTIDSPLDLTASILDLSDISCFGLCDGQVSALPGGGNPGYTFAWINNATGNIISTDSILQNLCAGDYYLRVTDANGCLDSSAVFSIIEPSEIVASPSVTDVSCNGVCDGIVQVTVTGGSPGYTFAWTNAVTNANIGNGSVVNGLCPGEYQIVVTDASGCFTDGDTVEVLDVLPFTMTLSGTDPTCPGTCNGSITATVVNGIAPFTWSPAPTSGQGTGVANYSNLCDGFYTISVQDNNGCSAEDTVTLVEPNAYDITVLQNNLQCFNDNSGSITVTVNSGGNGGPYTYNWLPTGLTGAGTNSVSNLSAGPYQVVISDGLCDTTLQFNVVQPNELLIDATVVGQSLCEGDCSGSSQVTIQGGTPTYNITWDDPALQSTGLAINLCPNTYHVVVTDNNMCSKTDSVVITESTGFNFTVTENDVNCFGACDGSATIGNISGGVPGYSIIWNDPNSQNTFTATNLCAGTYLATLRDANNCDTIITVVIDEPSQITFVSTVNDTACFGSCSGEVQTVASGGVGPYIYTWYTVNSNISIGSGSLLSNLCPGDYYAEIEDNAGCIMITDTLTVSEFPEIFINTSTVVDATCGVADGAITVTASGGGGSYSFNWIPAGVVGQGTNAISQLPGGIYQATVLDNNGCSDSITVPLSSGALEVLNTSGTDVSCFGLADGTANVNFVCLEPNCGIQWFNESGTSIGSTNAISNLQAGTYFVELTNGLGCTVIDSVIITEPNEIIATIASTDILCGGNATGTATVTATNPNLIYNWTPNPTGGQGTNQVSGLTPGVWSVNVSDISGCSVTLSTNIVSPQPIIIDNIGAQDISCAGNIDGSVFVSAHGGTPVLNYEWFTCGSGTSIGTGSSISNLAAGDYFVVITDGNNCVLNSNCVTISDKLAITAINTTSNASCFGECNGVISSVVSGGNGVYFYQWKDENQNNLVGQTNDTISNLCQGLYYLQVTDGNGCMEIFGPIDLTLPNLPWDISITPTDVSCFNDCDGSALITVNAGNTAPYTYSWNDPLNQTTAQGINLCAGNYSVLISDQANCDTTVVVQINNASPILSNAVQTNILCADDCSGAVTVSPSGGTGPYGVVWSNGDIGTTASNICAGAITASIIDDTGCAIDTTFNITEPMNPLSVASSFQNITDCGQCNGSATVNISGGTLPYTFVWSEPTVTGQGTNNVTGLCSGFISVTITDANGCTEIQSFLIQDVSGDSFTLNTTDASCFDICDGSASIIPMCTVPNCTQAWYNAVTGTQLVGTGTSISNLCQGEYIVALTNGAGCVSGDTFSIASPDELFIDAIITDVTCAGDADGSITVTPSGGSGSGYSYDWSPVPPNGNGTNTATGLSAGLYDLTVTDGLNCTISDSYTILDTTPIVLTAVSNDVSCNGSCNGNITVTALGGFGNYTYQWFNGGTPIPGETSSAIFNLCPGSYNVTVTDANGCSESLPNPVVISEPTQVNALVSDTDITCFGLCDGTATVTGSGGVGPYIYNWYNSSNSLIGQSTATATNLCEDDYYVIITDANNCSVTTSLTSVTEPTEITFLLNQSDIQCFGDCNASADITVNGGVPTYNYNWTDVSSGSIIGTQNSIANLCVGSYTIEATDQNGCSTGIIPVNIISPTELIIDVFTNNSDCNVANGSATAQVSGGLPIYSYQWLDENEVAILGETSSTFQNILAGTYYVVVIDDNNCDDTVQAVVVDNPSTTIQFDTVINPSCFGSTDGSISISIVGNNLPLNFLWNPGGQVVEDPINLGAGTYSLTVVDAAGCVSTYDTTLVDPVEIQMTPTITDPLCGECNGDVSVAVSGGVSPYNYQWNTGGTGNNIQNLCAGIYELVLEDANGCLITEPYAVGNSAAVSAEAIVTPITCFDNCDGEITVNVLTGTAPFTVTWLDDGFVGLTKQNLCSGTYFIEVTDAEGCVFPLIVELENPNEIFVTASMVLPNCGVNDGEISVTSTGGILPHVYSWNTNQSTPTISNLGAGVYILTVIDNNGTGCIQDFTFNLSNVTVPQVTLSKTDIDCHGNCNGEIITNTTGGTPNYTYQWFSGDGNLIVGENNLDITNRCAGIYTVEVTDNNGCTAYATEELFEPTPILFGTPNIQGVNCNGDCDGSIAVNSIGGTLPYTFLWNDPNAQTGVIASNLCDGAYSITVTDANNCQTSYTDSIVEPQLLVVTIDTIIQSQCKDTEDGSIQITISGGTLDYTTDWLTNTGLTFGTEDIVNALPMSYYLTVTDGNGCIVQDTAQIDTAVIVLVDAGNDTTICNLNESALIAISNQIAADYSWYDANAVVIGDTNIYFTGILNEGVYTFIAKAVFDGCEDFDTINVTVNGPVLVDAGPDIEMLSKETETIGGDPTTDLSGQIIWTPSIYLSDTTSSNPQVIQPKEDTWYYVEFTDSLGCKAIDSMYVEVIPEITVPEGISPNNDGKNDTWVINFNEDYPNLEVSVYNRWGELLFYDNTGYKTPWDGTYKGKALPVGTYYYVIELNTELYPDPFVGPLTILR